eukprot:9095532-Alexandrium_andersonii.AAC.1
MVVAAVIVADRQAQRRLAGAGTDGAALWRLPGAVAVAVASDAVVVAVVAVVAVVVIVARV